jgi:hypothetical protein
MASAGAVNSAALRARRTAAVATEWMVATPIDFMIPANRDSAASATEIRSGCSMLSAPRPSPRRQFDRSLKSGNGYRPPLA